MLSSLLLFFFVYFFQCFFFFFLFSVVAVCCLYKASNLVVYHIRTLLFSAFPHFPPLLLCKFVNLLAFVVTASSKRLRQAMNKNVGGICFSFRFSYSFSCVLAALHSCKNSFGFCLRSLCLYLKQLLLLFHLLPQQQLSLM